ncbi:MAG TPA: PAS domain-containing protein [Candidatus Acidoferrum sp.]|nr:PAS domain-containing protein [Candidatus Acidoferrum sp.]
MVHAACAGASREIWISQAIQELRLEPGGERCGVWLENPGGEEISPGRPEVFRGQVWEIGQSSGSGNWTQISMELPLPLESLAAGKVVEMTLPGESHEPVVSPTLGMQHVLWVPVLAQDVLRGLLLVASQDAETPLPRVLAEEVAGELGLAMEWERQALLARERQADLDLIARVHTLLASKFDGDGILAALAESCGQRDAAEGVGAVFALIGERRTGLAVAAPSSARAEERLQIRAISGDSAWGHSVEHGPLEMFWRQTVETGQITNAEAGGLPLAREIARIVAIPLAWEGATHGVLIAGLPRGRNHAEGIERLERRALLAAQVLQQKARLAERARMESWQRALLESSEQPVLLVDHGGFLRGMSRGAKKILAGESAVGALRWEKPELRFVELFRPREWERANRWLQSGRAGLRRGGEAEPEPLSVQLQKGSGVECRRLDLSSGEFLAVAIEPAASATRERRKEDVEAELRQTVNWMEEGVVLFDEGGGIRAANERFFRLLGLTSEEAAGAHTFEDLLLLVAGHAVNPEEFSRKWRELGESAETETQEELEFNWPSPRGPSSAARACWSEKTGGGWGAWRRTGRPPRGERSSRAWCRPRSWRRWGSGSAASCTN